MQSEPEVCVLHYYFHDTQNLLDMKTVKLDTQAPIPVVPFYGLSIRTLYWPSHYWDFFSENWLLGHNVFQHETEF
jgi:hypothetical protein